jgi:hypothetical protein
VVEETGQPLAGALDGAWEVSFEPNRGAPASLKLERLMDLSRHPDDGIRHFSGTATYRKTFLIPSRLTNHASLVLDLGSVHNLAEVIVNGHNLGVLWKQPFRVDITGALQDGPNQVEIRVTNLWVNRLIGDAKQMEALGITYAGRTGVIRQWPAWVPQDAPPSGTPVTFAAWRQWTGDEPLQPSGLVGPVSLLGVKKIAAKL